MLDPSYYQAADEIIAQYERDAKSLIPIMQDIQAKFRYLPAELLSYVAKAIGILAHPAVLEPLECPANLEDLAVRRHLFRPAVLAKQYHRLLKIRTQVVPKKSPTYT